MIFKLEMKLEPSLGPGSSVGEREKIGNETANKPVSEVSKSGRFGRVKGPLSSRLASFADFFGRFFFSPFSPTAEPGPRLYCMHQARPEGSEALTCLSVLGQ